MKRTRLVAANWKMHLLAAEARAFCAELRGALPVEGVEVAIFPSFPLLPAAAEALSGSDVGLGGQDLHPEPTGAHTGDVSGAQLADAGCAWVIVGHSERRRDHGEDDELVAAKLRAAARDGLRPILCLGETAEERRGGSTFAVLSRQLRAGLPHLGEGVVAYEPVWAIGTGDTATPQQAQEAHAFLRREASQRMGPSAGRLRLLYGGSVKPANAAELAAQPDVDGFLVGGASLDVAGFLAIIRACGAAAAATGGMP